MSRDDQPTDNSAKASCSSTFFDRRGYLKAAAGASVGAVALSRVDQFVGTADAAMEADPSVERYEIGGGIEYDNDVVRTDGDYYVETRSGLLSALSSASGGEIIWVENDARIDMTGDSQLSLPSGATLASGRGIDGQRGGVIHVDQGMDGDALFRCANVSDIRFTGLQLQGPHPYYFCPDAGEPDEPGYNAELSTAVFNYSNAGGYTAEIDNCHLWGWSQRAIAAGASSYENNIYVHHCSIHHNAIEHLGYGIKLNNGSDHLIEYNYFEMNRHAICGSGHPTNGYEARYNYVGDGPETIDHPFDMHNSQDNNGSRDVAGGTISIHHNTFEPEHQITVSPSECERYTRSGAQETMFQISGEPDNRCDIDDNWFMRKPKPGYSSTGSNNHAYNQTGTGSWSSIYASGNAFDKLSEPAAGVGHPRPDRALAIGSASAVDPNDSGVRSGVSFDVENTTGDRLTIFTVTVSPYDDAQTLLSDAVTSEGKWASEIHISSDVQSSACDVDKGVSIPGRINLVSDNDYGSNGWAIMSANSTAEVSIFRFFNDDGGHYTELDIAGSDLAVSLWYHRYDEDRKERSTARLEL